MLYESMLGNQFVEPCQPFEVFRAQAIVEPSQVLFGFRCGPTGFGLTNQTIELLRQEVSTVESSKNYVHRGFQFIQFK